MYATTTAARGATTISHDELVLSARRRIDGLTARYGADSPQVRAALTRWGAILDTRVTGDDLMALADTLGGAR